MTPLEKLHNVGGYCNITSCQNISNTTPVGTVSTEHYCVEQAWLVTVWVGQMAFGITTVWSKMPSLPLLC